jgi:hypothetical protein
MRRLFLELAKEKVQEAINRGTYQMTMLDRDLLTVADDWLADHPC